MDSRPLEEQLDRVATYKHSTLSPGDIIGEGLELHGEVLTVRPTRGRSEHRLPRRMRNLEVVRQLATKKSTLYLAREIHEDSKTQREYAMKVISRAEDETAWSYHISEAFIHESLPMHRNVVTLFRTYHTSSCILFVFEYFPGRTLLSYLEAHLDYSDVEPPEGPVFAPDMPIQVHFTFHRMSLVTSIFTQICDAVSCCHAAGVYHRNLKPSNFLIKDECRTMVDGTRERVPRVKLIDLDLATTDAKSAEMDCGSEPYMSYECRNNLSPTYSPRAADIWAMGVILINLIYHINPWTDTAPGQCPSFDDFKQSPREYLIRLPHMTPMLAGFLVDHVFCFLPNHLDDSQRVEAARLSNWSKSLPALIGQGYLARNHGLSLAETSPEVRRPVLRRSSSKPPVPAAKRLFRLPDFDDMLGAIGEEPQQSAAALTQTLAREIGRTSKAAFSSSSPAAVPPKKASYGGARAVVADVIASSDVELPPSRAGGRQTSNWRGTPVPGKSWRDTSPLSSRTHLTNYSNYSGVKSVTSQSSQKDRMNFYQLPPGSPMLR
ncbi:kinase-like protein [Auriscalpium vulgare]|uniref:Kinase-like protein n=1 Tax=Auriscalpium vulgare TaxID=40419 RepID=A0ACB8RNP2_9AGAM|nr:kinase-like protein [Auriscalpium vulgare]